MAKATATCTCAKCGKTFERSAYRRNRREADEWEAWASLHFDECPGCYRARLAAEREEENQKAAEAAKAAGMPELTGSPKQIAWATTIREKLLTACDTWVDERGREPDYDDFRSWLISAYTDSRYWIDNRSQSAYTLMAQEAPIWFKTIRRV